MEVMDVVAAGFLLGFIGFVIFVVLAIRLR